MVLGTLILLPNTRKILCLLTASVDIFFVLTDFIFFIISLSLHNFNGEFSVLFDEDNMMTQLLFVFALFLFTLFSLCVHLFSAFCLFSVSNWRVLFLRQNVCLNSLFLMVVLKTVNLILSTSFATLTSTTQSQLQKLLEKGLEKTMREYGNHLNYKIFIDRLQATYSCCGARNYKDWFNERWFRADYLTLPLNESMSQKYIVNGFFEGSCVPFSCCSVKSMRSCVNIFVIEDGHVEKYEPKHDKTIYLEGCGEKISSMHATHIIFISSLIICLNIVQLFNLLLCRLIQTAVQTAADHGDPTQTSYGYFFYFGIPLRPPGSRLASEALQRRKALMKRLAQRDYDAVNAWTDVKMAQLDEYYMNEGGRYNTTNNNTTSNNSSDNLTITTFSYKYNIEKEQERKKYQKKEGLHELYKKPCEKNIGKVTKDYENEKTMMYEKVLNN